MLVLNICNIGMSQDKMAALVSLLSILHTCKILNGDFINIVRTTKVHSWKLATHYISN